VDHTDDKRAAVQTPVVAMGVGMRIVMR